MKLADLAVIKRRMAAFGMKAGEKFCHLSTKKSNLAFRFHDEEGTDSGEWSEDGRELLRVSGAHAERSSPMWQ